MSKYKQLGAFFDNLPEFLSPADIEGLGFAKASTVYDWKYRPRKYDVPELLFMPKRSRNSSLKVSRDKLREWVASWEAN